MKIIFICLGVIFYISLPFVIFSLFVSFNPRQMTNNSTSEQWTKSEYKHTDFVIENDGKIYIDVEKCNEGNDWFGEPLGHTQFNVYGKINNQCSLEYVVEREMGYSRIVSCKIPTTKNIDVTYNEDINLISIDTSKIARYCNNPR